MNTRYLSEPRKFLWIISLVAVSISCNLISFSAEPQLEQGEPDNAHAENQTVDESTINTVANPIEVIHLGGVPTDIEWSPNGKFLAILHLSNLLEWGRLKLHLYETQSFREVYAIDVVSWNGGLDISPDGSTIAVESINQLTFYETESGREVGKLVIENLRDDFIGAYFDDFEYLIHEDALAVARGNIVQIWEIGRKVPDRSFGRLNTKVNAITLSADGSLLATGGGRDDVNVWDITNGQEVFSGANQPDRNSTAQSLSFSPDGLKLASAYKNGTIKIWDVNRGAVDYTLTGLLTEINIIKISFSSDGRLLAYGTEDNNALVWDVDNQKEFALLSGHTEWSHQATFSPTSNRLATGSYDGTVSIWEIGQ